MADRPLGNEDSESYDSSDDAINGYLRLIAYHYPDVWSASTIGDRRIGNVNPASYDSNDNVINDYLRLIARQYPDVWHGSTMGDHQIGNIDPYYVNDNVINDYMRLIIQRYPDVYAFDSHFFQSLTEKGYEAVMKWTRNVNIFSKRKIFVPIHLIHFRHWVMICVDFERKCINYYDSLPYNKNSDECIYAIYYYLIDEHRQKQRTDLNLKDWSLEAQRDIPKQISDNDSGVYLCIFTKYLAQGTPFNFEYNHMLSFRKLIVFELIFKVLVDVTAETSNINEFIKNIINPPVDVATI